jgi:hypothetical protein
MPNMSFIKLNILNELKYSLNEGVNLLSRKHIDFDSVTLFEDEESRDPIKY